MSARELGPGEHWFEDLEPGDRFTTGGLVITESHIVGFAGLSGDFFDVHMDDEFARAHGFERRIAHGLLVLSLADGLKNRSPVRLMGVASLGWNWSFKGPVMAGDRIEVTVTVKTKRLTSKGDRGVVTLGFTVTKQDGSAVQEGENILLMRRRPADGIS